MQRSCFRWSNNWSSDTHGSLTPITRYTRLLSRKPNDRTTWANTKRHSRLWKTILTQKHSCQRYERHVLVSLWSGGILMRRQKLSRCYCKESPWNEATKREYANNGTKYLPKSRNQRVRREQLWFAAVTKLLVWLRFVSVSLWEAVIHQKYNERLQVSTKWTSIEIACGVPLVW